MFRPPRPPRQRLIFLAGRLRSGGSVPPAGEQAGQSDDEQGDEHFLVLLSRELVLPLSVYIIAEGLLTVT